MAIAVGDVAQITYRAKLFGQRILTVQNYTVTAMGGAPGTETQELTKLLAYLNDPATGGKPLAEMIECQSDSVIYEEIRVQKVWPQRGVYLTQPCTVTGVIPDECDQPNTAAVLIKRSDYPGKKGHGDLHLAGIPNTQILEGALLVGMRTKVNEIGAALTTSFNPPLSDVTWWACINNGNLGPNTAIKYHTADDRIKTMRRRTLRVGE